MHGHTYIKWAVIIGTYGNKLCTFSTSLFVAIFTVDNPYDQNMYEITSSVEGCAFWSVKVRVKIKVKARIKLFLYKPDRPCSFQEVEAHRLHDSWYVKVFSLSALCTGHLYPPENIAGTNFCQRLSGPQGDSAAGRIMSMKYSNDAMGNRTRKLSACSTASQLFKAYVIDIIAYRYLMCPKRRGRGRDIDQTREGFVVVCMQ